MKTFLIIVCSLFALGLFCISPIIAYNTDSYVNVVVKDKQSVLSGSGETANSKYLIFTDNGVYENTDTVWYWKWNSSDFYNQIEVGKSYQFRVYGFRSPFMSWYKNIIEIK